VNFAKIIRLRGTDMIAQTSAQTDAEDKDRPRESFHGVGEPDASGVVEASGVAVASGGIVASGVELASVGIEL